MEGLLNQYLDQIKIGGKQVYKNLALFPLLSGQAVSLDYLTLDEALHDGLVEVTEVIARWPGFWRLQESSGWLLSGEHSFLPEPGSD